MGERIRTHDWAATPLGPIEAWPQSLKTAVVIMLTTRHPVFIFWGPEFVCLYNDAYAASLGPEKHPFVLGRPAPEAWPEAYPIVEPELKQVMAGGEATWQENNLVPIHRNGRIEEVYWTYSYGPIHEADAPHGVGGVLTFITETTRAVVAQRETEARYRLLFEALDQGFCVIDVVLDEENHPVDYVFVEINPAFEAQTGLRDAVGKSTRSLLPEHEEHWYETYGRIALTGEPKRFEHEAAALGRWYDVFAFPIGDREQRRVAVLFDDITDRKRAEQALTQSEERLRQVQEAARIGSFDFDLATGKAVASPEYLDLYGLPQDQSGSLTYEAWIGLVHPEDRPQIEAETQAAVADPTRHQLDYDFRIIRADTGETRWITARTKLIRDAGGRFVRSLGAQWDITADKNHEAALRESEARFRHMADSAPALIWMSDEAGQIVFANMHYDHVFGRPATEMLGDGWRDIVHPEDLPGFENDFFDAFAARRPFRTEVRVRDRNGAVRWLRCESVPRFDDARRFLGYTGCNVDITEAKVAEERRDLLIHELNHRVKNTLATVQSIVSQTLRNTGTAQEAKEAIENRLIALSRAHDVLTRESWEGADLYEIVEQAVAAYASQGEDRLHLKGPRVRLPPRMALALAMALQELATNAVKYGALSNASGEIRITWSVDQGEPACLHLRWEESGGPPVQAPTRRGFGSRLIERSLAQDLGGTATMAFPGTGLICKVDAPLVWTTSAT
ncbi:PAS domain S-box protein [Microvirga arabica]|uniref:Blue-light-activated histidine kinase n=1 Tax=Microvirga arabica TaxID=1128671 RepID=A0ABV6YBJ9_9HYPH